jgi:hypothetical protein
VGTGRDRQPAIEVDDSDVVDLVARLGALELPAEDNDADVDLDATESAPGAPVETAR